MRVKMISPAKTAADSVFWRSIKYSLFPPLGLATLAGYLDPEDEVDLQDEHVEKLDLDDEPDLVVIEAYITSAGRAYRYADRYRAKGAYVCLGGLHPTSLPDEAARHADSVFCGPGEDTWPAFLRDFRAGRPKPLYRSTERTLAGLPPARRDLIKRERYLVPNSLVVSRGCPHLCDFCYKEAFFRGGKSFYVQAVDDALAEIDRLPGRHLYFLDDNLFGSPSFAAALFDGLKGMGRVWQAAGTVQAVLQPGLLEKAVESGLRSLFVGFETLSESNLVGAGKTQNLAGGGSTTTGGRAAGGTPPYAAAVRRLHDLGVMVNGAFVFGMDGDDQSVFARTVDWAVAQGIETATFHIMTPYPGTRLERRLAAEGRITIRDWGRYDTRHAVFRPAGMTADELEAGYWGAYRDFYSWSSIWKSSHAHGDLREHARHLAYTSGWKKLEPMWDWAIRSGQVHRFLPLLETILDVRAVRSPPARMGRLRDEATTGVAEGGAHGVHGQGPVGGRRRRGQGEAESSALPCLSDACRRYTPGRLCRDSTNREVTMGFTDKAKQMADDATAKAKQAAADAKEKSGPALDKAKATATDLGEKAKATAADLSEKAKPTTDKAKAEAAEIIEKAKKQGAELIERAKTQGPELFEKAKKEAAELLERAQKEANELLEKAKGKFS